MKVKCEVSFSPAEVAEIMEQACYSRVNAGVEGAFKADPVAYPIVVRFQQDEPADSPSCGCPAVQPPPMINRRIAAQPMEAQEEPFF